MLPIGNTGADGADGADGAAGLNGTTVLLNSIADVSTTDAAAGAPEQLKIHTLGPYLTPFTNALYNNGDAIELSCSLSVNVTTSAAYVYLYKNGATLVPTPPVSFIMFPGTKFCLFKATISRITNTTVFIQFDVEFSGGTNYTSTGSQSFSITNVAVNALDSVTLSNTFAIFGSETAPAGVGANTLTAHNLLVTKLKI
jgi:hypothetical protein